MPNSNFKRRWYGVRRPRYQQNEAITPASVTAERMTNQNCNAADSSGHARRPTASVIPLRAVVSGRIRFAREDAMAMEILRIGGDGKILLAARVTPAYHSIKPPIHRGETSCIIVQHWQ